MARFSMTTGDADCRYLAAPGSGTSGTPFGQHLLQLGVALPSGMELQTLVRRGWIRPRMRVEFPARALLAWRSFPGHPMAGDEACPDDDTWVMDTWIAATSLSPLRDEQAQPLWMHWLDDPNNRTALLARQHSVDPCDGRPEPAAVKHPNTWLPVLPWIDYFADWQAYHLAELVRGAEFTVRGVTDTFGSCEVLMQRHTEKFGERARQLDERWKQFGKFFDCIASFRTILANCCTRNDWAMQSRLSVRSWAAQGGVEAEAIRNGVREVQLRRKRPVHTHRELRA